MVVDDQDADGALLAWLRLALCGQRVLLRIVP
jgi:hypothetical protein